MVNSIVTGTITDNHFIIFVSVIVNREDKLNRNRWALAIIFPVPIEFTAQKNQFYSFDSWGLIRGSICV